MGSDQSTAKAANAALKAVTGTDAVAHDSETWTTLVGVNISFDATTIEEHERDLQRLMAPHCARMTANNSATQNLTTLIGLVTVSLNAQSRDLPHGPAKFPVEVYNGLLLARIFLKDIVENKGPNELEDEFAGTENLRDFIRAAVDYAVEIGVWPGTYLVHMEILNVFMVLFSTQLYQPLVVRRNPFFEEFLSYAAPAGNFMTALTVHFTKQFRPLLPEEEAGWLSSVGSWIGSYFSSIALLPLNAYSYLFSYDNVEHAAPLADRSLLLLIILANHSYVENNPYREAMREMLDVDSADAENTIPADACRGSFSALYTTLCEVTFDERTSLLLYFLVHGNPSFRAYLLSRSDIDLLMLPLLQSLYLNKGTPQALYMTLAILLMLLEDEDFNRTLHSITIPHVPWFREQILSNISVGSLMFAVLLTAMHHNFSNARDTYLHDNCLACLSNMSGFLTDLHQYAAVRLFTLYSLLAKKHFKIMKREGGETSEFYESLTRLCAIIAATIPTLAHNPSIAYNFLHKTDVFEPFRTAEDFSAYVNEIDKVAAFFGARVDDASTVEEVEAQIGAALNSFNPADYNVPALMYNFRETPDPPTFFTPHVWSVVVEHANVVWKRENIRLFGGGGGGGGDGNDGGGGGGEGTSTAAAGGQGSGHKRSKDKARRKAKSKSKSKSKRKKRKKVVVVEYSSSSADAANEPAEGSASASYDADNADAPSSSSASPARGKAKASRKKRKRKRRDAADGI